MKFTVKRTKMLDAMKTVLAVVPDKSLIEEIRGILFTVNAGTGTVNQGCKAAESEHYKQGS